MALAPLAFAALLTHVGIRVFAALLHLLFRVPELDKERSGAGVLAFQFFRRAAKNVAAEDVIGVFVRRLAAPRPQMDG